MKKRVWGRCGKPITTVQRVWFFLVLEMPRATIGKKKRERERERKRERERERESREGAQAGAFTQYMYFNF